LSVALVPALGRAETPVSQSAGESKPLASNELHERAQWYNELTSNCTSNVRLYIKHIGSAHPWDWQLLVNGTIDEHAYELGALDTSLPGSSHTGFRCVISGDNAQVIRSVGGQPSPIKYASSDAK